MLQTVERRQLNELLLHESAQVVVEAGEVGQMEGEARHLDDAVDVTCEGSVGTTHDVLLVQVSRTIDDTRVLALLRHASF